MRMALALSGIIAAGQLAACSGNRSRTESTSSDALSGRSRFAVNIDPGNPAAWAQSAPSRLVADGFHGVRLVSRASIQPAIDQLKASGLLVMAVITEQSAGYVPWNADYLQIGNEPDDGNTYSSPQDYADLWVLYRNTYPQWAGRFVMAGLDSGGENAVAYATAALSAIGNRAPWPDMLDLHPYGKTTSEAAADFDLMWNQLGIPVIATEWHDEDDTWNFQCMLGNQDWGRSKDWKSVFAYTDAMVAGFGLRDSSGNPKPFYYSLLSAPSGCR